VNFNIFFADVELTKQIYNKKLQIKLQASINFYFF